MDRPAKSAAPRLDTRKVRDFADCGAEVGGRSMSARQNATDRSHYLHYANARHRPLYSARARYRPLEHAPLRLATLRPDLARSRSTGIIAGWLADPDCSSRSRPAAPKSSTYTTICRGRRSRAGRRSGRNRASRFPSLPMTGRRSFRSPRQSWISSKCILRTSSTSCSAGHPELQGECR